MPCHTWWRNFLDDRDIDILVQGHWLAMTARVVRGADESDELLPLLDEYLKRFPRAKASFGTALFDDMVKRPGGRRTPRRRPGSSPVPSGSGGQDAGGRDRPATATSLRREPPSTSDRLIAARSGRPGGRDEGHHFSGVGPSGRRRLGTRPA